MQFADFSPDESPSLDQQADALRKGLGRAAQWAMTQRLDDEPLLAACFKDQRYDAQIEESRAEWLRKLILAVDAVDRFRMPILHALYDLSDERSAYQLTLLELPGDDFDCHSLLMNVINVLENNPGADCSQLGIIAYASTRCGMCREHSVELLIRQQAAPGWLLEECRFDAVEGCRELAEPITAETRDEGG